MKSLFLSLALLAFSAGAHEGHDHEAPKTLRAPKGGQIKTLEETILEVVPKGNELKVYLYNKDLASKSTAGFKLTALAEMPRTKKKIGIDFLAKENFFQGNFDGQGSHRYTLWLSVTDPATGHVDKLDFNIEPVK